MIHFVGNSPQFQVWQTRLARVPRWGWIAFFVGVVLPIAIVGIVLMAMALLSGVLVLAVALAVGLVAAGVRRLLHRSSDDGRRNVQIMVRSVRVIDP